MAGALPTLLCHAVRCAQVQSYDTVNHTWVYYYRLTTVRFAAVNINITSKVPEAFDMLPITLPDGDGGCRRIPLDFLCQHQNANMFRIPPSCYCLNAHAMSTDHAHIFACTYAR